MPELTTLAYNTLSMTQEEQHSKKQFPFRQQPYNRRHRVSISTTYTLNCASIISTHPNVIKREFKVK